MWYLKIGIEIARGVTDPCNGLYVSLLCFDCLSGQNFDARCPEENGSFAFKSKCREIEMFPFLTNVSILLLCRVPIEDREFSNILELPHSIAFVP